MDSICADGYVTKLVIVLELVTTIFEENSYIARHVGKIVYKCLSNTHFH